MTREEEFNALIERYDGAVRRISGVYAGADGEADDLYQEILLQLWRSFPSFKGDSKAGTWLYRVALNTALTWKRRATRQKRGPAAAAEQQADQRAGARDASARSQKEILAEFLDLLSGPDRWVLLLYMEGLKHDEIADVTGLTVTAVGVRIHRMKALFTERYLEP